ncbi:MAG: hypothetical protein ACR2HP_01030, partial [Ilumatobacteraceae bacterium]
MADHFDDDTSPFFDPAHADDVADDAAWERFGNENVQLSAASPRRHRAAIGADPRLMRVGALAAAAVLLVPVVVALAADDGSSGDEVRTSAVATSVVASTLPPQSEATTPPPGV